jgi:hypothetical protein
MSSPSPSTAHVLECTSVQLAIHEQREVNLPGQRRRTGLSQEQPPCMLPVGASFARLRQRQDVGVSVANGAEHAPGA